MMKYATWFHCRETWTPISRLIPQHCLIIECEYYTDRSCFRVELRKDTKRCSRERAKHARLGLLLYMLKNVLRKWTGKGERDSCFAQNHTKRNGRRGGNICLKSSAHVRPKFGQKSARQAQNLTIRQRKGGRMQPLISCQHDKPICRNFINAQK